MVDEYNDSVRRSWHPTKDLCMSMRFSTNSGPCCTLQSGETLLAVCECSEEKRVVFRDFNTSDMCQKCVQSSYSVTVSVHLLLPSVAVGVGVGIGIGMGMDIARCTVMSLHFRLSDGPVRRGKAGQLRSGSGWCRWSKDLLLYRKDREHEHEHEYQCQYQYDEDQAPKMEPLLCGGTDLMIRQRLHRTVCNQLPSSVSFQMADTDHGHQCESVEMIMMESDYVNVVKRLLQASENGLLSSVQKKI